MRPLDLILFSGTDLISDVVKAGEYISLVENKGVEKILFSHIGIVVNSEVLPSVKELQKDKFYILESTSNISSLDGPLNVEGNRKFGVQIRDLQSVIQTYKGKVYYGSLINYPTTVDVNVIKNVYDKYINCYYDLNFIDLLATVFKCFRRQRKCFDVIVHDIDKLFIKNYDKDAPDNMLFCSQLVAIILRDVGVLPSDVKVLNYLPEDVFGYRNGLKIVEEFNVLK